MKARLQRGLQITKQVERELQIPREVFFGKRLRNPSQARSLAGRPRDQPRVAPRDPRHQQIPEIAGEFAAEMLQVLSIALQLIDSVQHPVPVAGAQPFRHPF